MSKFVRNLVKLLTDGNDETVVFSEVGAIQIINQQKLAEILPEYDGLGGPKATVEAFKYVRLQHVMYLDTTNLTISPLTSLLATIFSTSLDMASKVSEAAVAPFSMLISHQMTSANCAVSNMEGGSVKRNQQLLERNQPTIPRAT